MAPSMLTKIAFISIISVICLQSVKGALTCEELPVEVCAFSVSSSGARCVLEKSILRDGSAQYECMRSEVMAEKMYEWIETEECINNCGLEKMAIGMSSDGLMESTFTAKLCSSQCYDNCPNIVNLYSELAAGEGLYLPRLCEAQRSGSRRMIAEVLSVAKTSIIPESFEFAATSPAAAITASSPLSPPSP